MALNPIKFANTHIFHLNNLCAYVYCKFKLHENFHHKCLDWLFYNQFAEPITNCKELEYNIHK